MSAIIVLLAFTYSEGLWTGFSNHSCSEDCPDDPGQCPPTSPDAACTCSPHVGNPVPVSQHVALLATTRETDVTFADPPGAQPPPDPHEILHVPLLAR